MFACVCVCVCVYEIQGYRTRKCYHSLPYSKSRTNFRLTVNMHTGTIYCLRERERERERALWLRVSHEKKKTSTMGKTITDSTESVHAHDQLVSGTIASKWRVRGERSICL